MSIFTLAEELELFQVKQASLVLIHSVKERFDILKGNLDAMLFEHLLQFLCVKSARTIVIELKEDTLDIVLCLQLHLCLHIEIFGGVLVAGHEPVLCGQISHYVAHIATVNGFDEI